jgi:hypothetical protein
MIAVPAREYHGVTGGDYLPLAPYAVLMQRMVMQIGGVEPGKRLGEARRRRTR